MQNVFEHSVKEGKYIFALFPVRVNNNRVISNQDKEDIKGFLDMIISSQAQVFLEKVQRLSADTEYRPIAIGSGSARVPKHRFLNIDDLRDMI